MDDQWLELESGDRVGVARPLIAGVDTTVVVTVVDVDSGRDVTIVLDAGELDELIARLGAARADLGAAGR